MHPLSHFCSLRASIAQRLICMALAALSCASPAIAATEQGKASTAVLLQGFHWNSANYSNPNWYGVLRSKAVDLKTMGFTHVWFPPPSDSAAKEGYLPRQLNKLDSSYGTEADLKAAIAALAAQGIKSTADIVVNHRVGTTGWSDFTNPSWGLESIVTGDECNCGTGGNDTGTGYSAARDLAHNQATVQNGIQNWLSQRLKEAGFSGLRYDYAKGYNASYAKQYHDAMAPDFCVGEVWTNLNLNDVNPHRQELMNYIDGAGSTCAAFDFTTKGLLNQVLSNNDYWRLRDTDGKPQGAIGWWAQKSVTFVDNHDTGPSESCNSGQNLWAVPCDKVMQGYAYILTHPGIPTVYYPHIYDWNLKDAIYALMQVRKSQGVTSTSSIAIQRAETGLYAAIINNNVAMKIGPNSWSPGAGWVLATSGSNYAVWKK
jgi:alpha-amylase